MYSGGYWGAPESCWIRKRASQGADLERDKDKAVQAKEKTSLTGVQEERDEERDGG